jgi:hypothetical protein
LTGLIILYKIENGEKMTGKKKVFCILFLLNCIYISSQDEFSPIVIPPRFPTVIYEDISLFYIGKDISNYNIINKRFQTMVSSSQFWPYFMVCFDGTYYTIAFDDDNKIRAIFISLYNEFNHQQSFRTPEGVYVGMKYSDLKKIEPNIILKRMPGWGYRGVLSSGWKVAFFIGETATEHYPGEDDIIGSIFKD